MSALYRVMSLIGQELYRPPSTGLCPLKGRNCIVDRTELISLYRVMSLKGQSLLILLRLGVRWWLAESWDPPATSTPPDTLDKTLAVSWGYSWWYSCWYSWDRAWGGDWLSRETPQPPALHQILLIKLLLFLEVTLEVIIINNFRHNLFASRLFRDRFTKIWNWNYFSSKLWHLWQLHTGQSVIENWFIVAMDILIILISKIFLFKYAS